jgi:hypothetical protein
MTFVSFANTYPDSNCTKRLLVNFKSSLLLKIIYKYYSYLQTHLHLMHTNLQKNMKADITQDILGSIDLSL